MKYQVIRSSCDVAVVLKVAFVGTPFKIKQNTDVKDYLWKIKCRKKKEVDLGIWNPDLSLHESCSPLPHPRLQYPPLPQVPVTSRPGQGILVGML